MRILLFSVMLIFAFSTSKAQTDTIAAPKAVVDTAKTAKSVVVKDSARLAIEAMPGKAMRKSALLPGLGQVYNKRWWKVPIIYGGFVSLGLAYNFNQKYYKEFLGEVQYRLDHNMEPKNPDYAGYSYEGMVTVKDAYRRNRDLSIIGMVALYAVNILDAYVDAKFFRYDISDDFALKIVPSYQPPVSAFALKQPGTYMIKLNFAL